MRSLTTILALAAVVTGSLAQYHNLNTSREYNIRTCLKPGQPGKERFDNLWLEDYRT